MLINVQDAKTKFFKLLEQAHAGEEIILAKAGKPYARLVPLAQSVKKRTPGRLPSIDDSRFFDALPDEGQALGEGRGADNPP